MNFSNGIQLLELSKINNNKISEAVLNFEVSNSGNDKNEIIKQLQQNWNIMKESIDDGIINKNKGHMIGGESKKLKERYTKNKSICGELMSKAICYSLAVMEVNVCMGKIVACPTAGSSGVLPSVLKIIQEEFELNEDKIIDGLLTASGIGIIIGKNACLAGAKGGCQAEVGSASAMAAGAVVEMLGGSPEQVLSAAAICLKNLMGLICDPVAGLVEVPCQKRNAIGVSNALISSEMVMAGIDSVIPFDEVVQAMNEVSKAMPTRFKETSEGGIAITPTAKKLEKEIFN